MDENDCNIEKISLIIEPKNNVGGLYLGDYTSIKHKNLEKLKIKAIISVIRYADTENSKKLGYEHICIPVNDIYDADIKKYFQTSNEFIDLHLKDKNVIVHCLAGVSRSPTLIASYLMWKNKWGSDETLQFIKQHRNQVSPNKGFLQQLKQYEAELLK